MNIHQLKRVLLSLWVLSAVSLGFVAVFTYLAYQPNEGVRHISTFQQKHITKSASNFSENNDLTFNACNHTDWYKYSKSWICDGYNSNKKLTAFRCDVINDEAQVIACNLISKGN